MQKRKEMLMQIVNELNKTAEKIAEYNKLMKETGEDQKVISIDWSPENVSCHVASGFTIHMRSLSEESSLNQVQYYTHDDYHAKYVDVGTARLFSMEKN